MLTAAIVAGTATTQDAAKTVVGRGVIHRTRKAGVVAALSSILVATSTAAIPIFTPNVTLSAAPKHTAAAMRSAAIVHSTACTAMLLTLFSPAVRAVLAFESQVLA